MKKFFLRHYRWEQGLEKAMRDLTAGAHRHDVLKDAICCIELDEAVDSVGFGGFPNLLGEMELDAAFMDGDDRAVGAVAGVTRFLPVNIAYELMKRNMHVLIAGSGAELFARACGLKKEQTLSAAQEQKWRRDVKPLVDRRKPAEYMDLVQELAEPKKEFDTITMIASDGNGLSTASSTAGWPYKFPGRIGDAPLAGAGFYVDSRCGGCLCTYTGEMAIRTAMSHFVVMLLKGGTPVHDAIDLAVKELDLKTGLRRGFCIHAIDAEARERALAINIDESVHYQYWCEGMNKPERRLAESVTL